MKVTLLALLTAAITWCVVIGGASQGLKSVRFDEQDALTSLYYAYAAFCPIPNLQKWDCQWCQQDRPVDFVAMLHSNSTEAYGFVAVDNSTIYVSFRGTQGMKNILDDLEFFEIADHPDLPGTKVHAGFLRAFMSVRDDFRAALLKLSASCPYCSRLLATGHSLGAAVSGFAAVDAALYFAEQRSSVRVAMQNFGMPRIGDAKFADAFAKLVAPELSWRLVHNRDIVPHLPPKAMGFHQVPLEVWNRDNVTEATAAAAHRSASDFSSLIRRVSSSSAAEDAGALQLPVPPPGETYTVCAESGEDPACSDGAGPIYRPPDHLVYMGVHNNNCGT